MTNADTNTAGMPELPQSVRDNWLWFVLLGLFFLIGGGFAILMPLASSIAVKTVIAVIFLITGIVQVFQAFRVQGWGGFLWGLLMGAVFVIAGGVLLTDTFAGLITLTIILAASFVAQGVFEAILGFRSRPMPGWGWVVASGVISVIVGIMIWQRLPVSAGWALGLMAGIGLISSGVSFMALGFAARSQS